MRHPERYTAIRLLALLGLIGTVGFLGLACSLEIDAETAVPPTATACIEIGAEATAIAFVASLPEGTRQSAQGQLTRLAPDVPKSVCITPTVGPDIDATMKAVLATPVETTSPQP